MNSITIDSPIGLLTLAGTSSALTSLFFGKMDTELLLQAVSELREYFAGRRKEFDIPLGLTGTEFQKKVWYALGEIPYGETRSYGEIARAMGSPRAVRAVGLANHKNPIPILIPCHRVIGSDGTMVGYGGGLDTKKFLLELEQKYK